MKRSIVSYGDETYTDCRPCEMEAAEEHVDGELSYEWGYKKKAGYIVGYNLKDEGEINQKAEEVMKRKIVGGFLNGMDEVDIQVCEPGSTKPSIPHGKPVVVRTTSRQNNLFEWAWDFTADEDEYGCTLECQGTVKIIKKQNPNPNIPKPSKKRARSAIAAPMPAWRRREIMPTNILYPEDPQPAL